jgi:hypothetical protein
MKEWEAVLLIKCDHPPFNSSLGFVVPSFSLLDSSQLFQGDDIVMFRLRK